MAKRELVPLSGARAVADQAMKDAGLAAGPLSVEIGRNSSYLQQWLRYNVPRILPEKERHLLADRLGLDQRQLREPDSGVDDRKTMTATHAMRIREPREERALLGRVDLKVFAAVEGGPGEMVVNTDPIDLVRRPWFLEHVSDAFAVVVTGDSMDPVYEAGDLVLVNPKLPVIRNKDAIFTSDTTGGDFRASIKRYTGQTDTHWIARQFTPPRGQKEEVRFAKDVWRRAYRVVGKYIP